MFTVGLLIMESTLTIKIRGIKRGQTIELLQDINIPDGSEVIIDIHESQLMNNEERQRRLKEFFETNWEGREDFIKTMEELEKEKKC
jgi:predicted DNA-binding antitoxin AbrB/MazE fold protein